MKRKVAVFGLDCAEPSLVLGQWLDELPSIRALVNSGISGNLRSIDPPITVPAWSAMMSSRDPGALGVYGFRNRKDYSYSGLSIANSLDIKVDRVWDILGRAGKDVILVGIPQTYPPPDVRGALVSCFLTPDPRRDEYTFPRSLKPEIEALVGGYEVDVRNFRSDQRDRILSEIYTMTEQRFEVARHLLATRPWDFFMMVEIGVDRIHHAFWRYLDPRHPQYQPNHRFANVIREYYHYLDDQIGEIVESFDDDTSVLVVSDHGAQPMEGAICVNEWLVREGYLVLKNTPDEAIPFARADVDWAKTRVWGEGGYYCRLCLNIRDREPEGIVALDEVNNLCAELTIKLESLAGPDGQPIGTRVFRPEELWPIRRGIPPDLIVYFGNLAWRSNGTVGGGQIYTFENDTGPDDANHAVNGLFILTGPDVQPERRDDVKIFDVAPTILSRLDLPIPGDMQGRPVASRTASVA